MSNPSRCHDCGHKRGPRSTGNTTAAGIPKKAECRCVCHVDRINAADLCGDLGHELTPAEYASITRLEDAQWHAMNGYE